VTVYSTSSASIGDLYMINFLQITKHFHLYHRDKSWWAYKYCKDIEDKPEVKKYITHSNHAFWYCKDVKDRPEIRKLITTSFHAYRYCKEIQDRPEVAKHITDSYFLELYHEWEN